MKQTSINIPVQIFTDSKALDPADAILLDAAREATGNAYAPYSKFRVGAAIRLDNGQIRVLAITPSAPVESADRHWQSMSNVLAVLYVLYSVVFQVKFMLLTGQRICSRLRLVARN